MKSTARPYFPNLDGLRFFAFLLVFISHATLFIWRGPSYLAQGDLGVSFFFVLSGFLITYLVLYEQEATGDTVKLTNFYGKRIVRIWPVYIITICIGIIIASMHIHVPFSTNYASTALPWFTGFIANFYLIQHPDMSVLLAILWSISIEEQFYLVWPLLLITVKKNYIPSVLVLIIVLGSMYRALHSTHLNVLAYGTFSNVIYLAVGALTGWYIYHTPKLVEKIKNLFTARAVYVLYILIIVFIGVKIVIHTPIIIILTPLLFSLLSIGIILEQNYSAHSLYKIGNFPSFTYLGKISYGLYAYHMIAIAVMYYIFFILHIHSNLLLTVTAFLLVIGMASISYTYIEQKILRLRQYLQ